MDKASDYESGDCRFESCQGQNFSCFFHNFLREKRFLKIVAPPGGLEPPTFRLTAERASQLRHGGQVKNTLAQVKHREQEFWLGLVEHLLLASIKRLL